MNNYCVYFHINPLKNHVFYVGMGKPKRPYDKTQRSNIWKRTVRKYRHIVDVVEENLTKKQAEEREKFYINKIGRRDLGQGTLINQTDGGYNTRSGKKNTNEHNLKVKLALAKYYENHPSINKGIPMSEAQKEKLRSKKRTEEQKQNVSKALRALKRKLTPEQRLLVSIRTKEAMANLPQETKDRIAKTQYKKGNVSTRKY